MIVTQKDNKLTVETFRVNRDGDEVSTVAAYTLDGEKSKNDTEYSTRVSTAKWEKDGTVLVISSTMTMSRGDREFTSETIEKWSLDKERLTVESTRKSQRGDRTSKLVYDKAEKK